MEGPTIPDDEAARLAAVKKLGILDTQPEERFDVITRSAAKEFNAPISTISIVDAHREWFKSKVGPIASEGDRKTSFCGHTIVRGKLFVVEDTHQDPMFQNNPQVVDPPHIRFYAGVTLLDHKTHQPVGAFCIKDTKPRKLSLTEINSLLQYADRAEQELNGGQPNTSTLSIEPGSGPTDTD